MNSRETQRISLGALLLASISGALSGLVIASVLVILGVSVVEAALFSTFGAIGIAYFVWIERSLTDTIKQGERALSLETERRLEWQNRLYSSSLACLVRFDTGTLAIERVSPGFIRMLRLSADTDLSGKRLDEVLQISPLVIESFVDSIKKGEDSPTKSTVEIRSSGGLVERAHLSGLHFPNENVIEAAFFVPPINDLERAADLESTREDLDRFRKGVFRRETRILELKAEVNQVCREAGLPIRYETDISSESGEFGASDTIRSSNREDEGGVS
ncbi:MAG: hypothetical protein ACPGGN_01875 [Opitutales bacterium]